MDSEQFSFSVTALVERPAAEVFDFLSDPIKLGNWSFGCFATEPELSAPGVFTGRSLFDGSRGWFEILPHPETMTIDYALGTVSERSVRISARVIPGPICELDSDCCYATLTAWRTASMDEARWHRLKVSHEAEILLIKAQIESDFACLSSLFAR